MTLTYFKVTRVLQSSFFHQIVIIIIIIVFRVCVLVDILIKNYSGVFFFSREKGGKASLFKQDATFAFNIFYRSLHFHGIFFDLDRISRSHQHWTDQVS